MTSGVGKPANRQGADDGEVPVGGRFCRPRVYDDGRGSRCRTNRKCVFEVEPQCGEPVFVLLHSTGCRHHPWRQRPAVGSDLLQRPGPGAEGAYVAKLSRRRVLDAVYDVWPAGADGLRRLRRLGAAQCAKLLSAECFSRISPWEAPCRAPYLVRALVCQAR